MNELRGFLFDVLSVICVTRLNLTSYLKPQKSLTSHDHHLGVLRETFYGVRRMDDDDNPALRRPSVNAAYNSIYGHRDQDAEDDDDIPNHDAEVLRDICLTAHLHPKAGNDRLVPSQCSGIAPPTVDVCLFDRLVVGARRRGRRARAVGLRRAHRCGGGQSRARVGGALAGAARRRRR